MADIRRVKPEEARRRAEAGDALLVCAYENEETCDRMRLEGAMTLGELNARLPTMPGQQEIIFYCK